MSSVRLTSGAQSASGLSLTSSRPTSPICETRCVGAARNQVRGEMRYDVDVGRCLFELLDDVDNAVVRSLGQRDDDVIDLARIGLGKEVFERARQLQALGIQPLVTRPVVEDAGKPHRRFCAVEMIVHAPRDGARPIDGNRPVEAPGGRKAGKDRMGDAARQQDQREACREPRDEPDRNIPALVDHRQCDRDDRGDRDEKGDQQRYR